MSGKKKRRLKTKRIIDSQIQGEPGQTSMHAHVQCESLVGRSISSDLTALSSLPCRSPSTYGRGIVSSKAAEILSWVPDVIVIPLHGACPREKLQAMCRSVDVRTAMPRGEFNDLVGPRVYLPGASSESLPMWSRPIRPRGFPASLSRSDRLHHAPTKANRGWLHAGLRICSFSSEPQLP